MSDSCKGYSGAPTPIMTERSLGPAYAVRQVFEVYPSPTLSPISHGPVAQSGGATDF